MSRLIVDGLRGESRPVINGSQEHGSANASARELLGWAQEDLAEASGVSVGTIRRLEAAGGDLGGYPETRTKIMGALFGAGVEFTPDDDGGFGVKLRRGRR
jgi:transcriptional regulator with XRE-family HTH domain